MYHRLNPKFQPDVNENLRIYKLPIQHHSYIVGVDSASGIPGRNLSAIQVLDMDTAEQVACYWAEIPPDRFMPEVEKIGFFYNTALIGVELEKYGMIVIHLLRDSYPNLYYHSDNLTTMQPNVQKQYGWNPVAGRNRQIAIDLLKMDLGMNISESWEDRQLALKIYDHDTRQEMQWFCKDDKGKEQAASGKTDDKLAALWIANHIRHERILSYHAYVKPHEETFMEKMMNAKKAGARDLGKRDYYAD